MLCIIKRETTAKKGAETCVFTDSIVQNPALSSENTSSNSIVKKIIYTFLLFNLSKVFSLFTEQVAKCIAIVVAYLDDYLNSRNDVSYQQSKFQQLIISTCLPLLKGYKCA